MSERVRLASPRLHALVTGQRAVAADRHAVEDTIAALRNSGAHSTAQTGPVCELCAAPIAEQHRHLVEIEQRELRCVCRACSVLFDRRGAGGAHYRLVPERVLRITDFVLPEHVWQALRIPVELAFLFYSSAAGRVVAFYPGPMGATESLLELDRWNELVHLNPVLQQIEPDVEALLVNRTGDAEQYWLVPIDACYELVGVMRAHWKGLAGGQEVWEKITLFFEQLAERASVVTAH